ncbi:hypothetical protein [Gluconobacter sp.]|uniref:hypothetical protein n=1 Tax=Gluconobacter sp. TaxID=1876758 RepID=UPI0039EB61B6
MTGLSFPEVIKTFRTRFFPDPILQNIVLATFSLACLIFFGWACWKGLWFLSFCDEADHLLGGRILNEGGRLYVSYVDSHGPLIFMLAQLYGALFGWHFPQGARLLLPVLALMAAASITVTPALSDRRHRLLASTIFIGGLASYWLMDAFYMVSFYAVAGFLTVGLLALFVVPAWSGSTPALLPSALAGVCLVLILACAYAYGPGVLLIVMSAVWLLVRQGAYSALRAFAGGALFAVLLLGLWFLRFADLGSFVVFHILFNQIAYAPFIHFGPRTFLHSLLPSFRGEAFYPTLAHLLLAGSLTLMLYRRPTKNQIAILAGFAGIILLNARAAVGFKDGQTLIMALALSGLALTGFAEQCRKSGAPVFGITLSCSVLLVLAFWGSSHLPTNTPFGWTYRDTTHRPPYTLYQPINDAVSRKVRALVPPGQPILMLPYMPEFYWMADRQPPYGYYEYLPWDWVYARHSIPGYPHDLCQSLLTDPPPLIVYTPETDPASLTVRPFFACIREKLATLYIPVEGFPSLHVLRPR